MMNSRFKYVGQSLASVDGPAKAAGATLYLTDISLEGMVWGYPVFSSIPFGRIRSIDLKQARSVPGYIETIFAADIPGENQIGLFVDDQPLLATDTVRFVGDVIGLVIAETREAAFRSSRLVRIEYDEYPAIESINASKAATGDYIHASNVACQHQVLNGDWETGFADSDLIVEGDFRTPFQEHLYLEPQGCIVLPESNGHIDVLGSLQCPFYVRKAVARVMGIDLEKVQVTQTPTGGAFGGKEDVPSELAARLAVAAGIVDRPVKMVYRRRDDVQLTSKRHPFQMHYKVGVTRDGILQAADILLESNAGAYATLSPVVSYRSTMQAMGPYHIPAVRVRSTAWYTNLPPTGAFRGFGSPQATFGHERIMDLIANRLGMDPLELRQKNILHTGDATLTGHQLTSSVGAEETLVKARDASNWSSERSRKSQDNRYLTGIGIASSHYGNCLGAAGWHMDGAGANIRIHHDGSVSVAYGLTDMGQGANTVVAQMTAEALGVDPKRITVLPTSTRNVPDSGPSVASRNVVMTGNAIRDAASKLVPVLRSAGAAMLAGKHEDLVIENDVVRDSRTDATVSFSELVEYLYRTDTRLESSGWWHVPELEFDKETGVGQAYFTYSYATHIARIKLDTLTGLIHVDKIWAAHDVGKVINPAGLEGQVEGGTAQGVGYALTEQFSVLNGRVTSDNFSTYLLPTIRDVPEVETIIVESAEPLGPWGAKGVGEPAIIPTAAAITNAVSHALGVEVNAIPIIPEQVLDILTGKAGGNSAGKATASMKDG